MAGMKILVVTHGFPPDQMAGAEIYAFNVSREMARRGHEVVVLSPAARSGHEEYELVEEELDGMRVLRLVNTWREQFSLADTYANPRIDAAFAALLERERPDVVHIHHTIGTTANTAPLAKERCVPSAITLHDFWFHCARGQRMTPGGHLCDTVQPWRCAVCVGKKRGRYGYDGLRAHLAGRTDASRDKSGLRRALELVPRAIGYGLREAGPGTIRRRLETMTRALGAADLLLAPSEFMLEAYARNGAPRERLVFSEYGMDSSRFADFTPKPPPREGEKVCFGFVGTLIPTKGCELLVRAFQSMPSTAELELHGVGGGPNGARYEERLRQLNRHPGVRFMGGFDNREVGRVLGRFDVLCVPSLWYENAPLTLHESVMAGLPAITANHGGMKEFAARFGTALTFEPGDEISLAATLLEFHDAAAEWRDRASRPEHAVRTVEDDVDGLLEHFERMVAADNAPRP